MLARLPRDMKNSIHLFLGHELNWEELHERAQEYSGYCNHYINEDVQHRSLLKCYARNKSWELFHGASRHWKREGKQLRRIIVEGALDLQLFFLVCLPPGVHYTEIFD